MSLALQHNTKWRLPAFQGSGSFAVAMLVIGHLERHTSQPKNGRSRKVEWISNGFWVMQSHPSAAALGIQRCPQCTIGLHWLYSITPSGGHPAFQLDGKLCSGDAGCWRLRKAHKLAKWYYILWGSHITPRSHVSKVVLQQHNKFRFMLEHRLLVTYLKYLSSFLGKICCVAFTQASTMSIWCISHISNLIKNLRFWNSSEHLKKNLTPDLLIWNFRKVLMSENSQKFRTFQKLRI